MKTINITFLIFLFSIVLPNHSFGKSPVWKVSNNGNHIFLGGTFHILTPSDYPLPDSFEMAYSNSSHLVLEADLQKLSSPEFSKTIMKECMYPGEQNIRNFLDPATIQSLESHLAKRGIPIDNLIKLKPGFLSATLTVIELQRLGLVGTGVDEFFSLKSLNERRKITYLETVNEQLEFIANMGEGNENEYIKHTLNELKTLPKLMDSMKKAWRNGNNKQLREVALDPLKERFPKTYNSMLVNRNNNWIPKIEAMLKTQEIEFILFGTLHLVGKEGILKQLEDIGCTIENI